MPAAGKAGLRTQEERETGVYVMQRRMGMDGEPRDVGRGLAGTRKGKQRCGDEGKKWY